MVLYYTNFVEILYLNMNKGDDYNMISFIIGVFTGVVLATIILCCLQMSKQ